MQLSTRLMLAAALPVALFTVAVPAPAQNRGASTQGLPPLIDRELLFGNPELIGAQISPDGKFIAFQKPWKDTRNIWVKKTDEPFANARLLTTETKRPIAQFFWSQDGARILFVKDNDGDENFNLYAIDPNTPTPAGADAPEAKDMTGAKGIQVALYSLPKSQPKLAYIGLNDRDKAWHDLYRLDLSTGTKTLVRKNTDRIAQWVFDLKGDLRMAFRVADNGDQEILRVDEDKFTRVYHCGVFEACAPVRFHKDSKRIYIETNKGDGTDLSELQLMDPATGTTEFVERDPLKRVDFGAAVFSDVTDDIAATTYMDDQRRIYFKDKALEADYHWLQKQKPGKQVNFSTSTRDEQLWIVAFNGDTEPGETYLFDRKAKKITLQYRQREKISRDALSPMTTIRYKSSDGLEVPAYLTLPKGLPAKNLPVMVMPHGGPWARDVWGFNPYHQFLANRGYAVLSPNFRGSTGFGKKFLNLGNGEWGKKMQDDVTWGVKHLIAQGIADPKRVGIMGGSYGGYTTLAGVAFTPDVYRAGVDIVGPSNLITLLNSIPPYWEAFKKVMFTRMADPATAEGKAWLAERSPLNSAAKIKTPLMVVQGANDPRVNKAEAEQIVIALRDRKFPVEYILAPDEGHGFARPVNNMAMLMAIEKFLARHLDGRYQEGATPEVAKRLTEITVDPATVKLAEKVDTSSASAAPKLSGTVTPGVLKFDAKIVAGTREIKVGLSSSIKEENGAWTAVDTMDTPMGAVTDTSVLDKQSLIVLKREVKQGPVTVTISVDGNKVTGTMDMNGQKKPIEATLTGPLFADAAGSTHSYPTLPLAEGYTTTLRNFDVQTQKEKLIKLSVIGSESVTVPAGSFEAFKVDVVPADGSAGKVTLWIAKEERKLVRMTASMPQMGGATMTAELTK